MCKLPTDVRLQIARNTKKDVWVIKDLLELIRKEVEARELSKHVKANNEVKRLPNTNAKNVGSIASLVAQGGQEKGPVMIKCVSCAKPHYPASCDSVSNLKDRKDIL